MASIKDVAALAQVSVSTVSHVVNGTRFVSTEKTKAVNDAIQALNYRPSFVAKALKGRGTQTIGMLVTNSTNPFFAEVVAGVEEACHRSGYSLILGNAGHTPERQIRSLAKLTSKQIDALVIMTTNREPEFITEMAKLTTLPKVILDSEPLDNGCAIGDDSFEGAYLATRHLMDRGHRKIAVITGPQSHDRSGQRLAGVEHALGHPVPEPFLVHGELDLASGLSSARQLLKLSDRPSAIFAFNDLMAIGTYRAANELNIRVPNELSVIGYDDIELAGFLTPPLTSVRQSGFEIGETTGAMLTQHLLSAVALPPAIKLEPHLIERSSVSDFK